jgi:hypothetical protein
VIFVDETFAREDEPTVKSPVEEEKVRRREEVAVPPNCPKRSWVFTHAVELGSA